MRRVRSSYAAQRGSSRTYMGKVNPAGLADDLETSAVNYEDFFENAAVGLHVVDGDGLIVHANSAELSLLGYEPGDYIGHEIAG
ncbi:MAG: PAS domain-containing protein, partial [Mesorhizobium sp.]